MSDVELHACRELMKKHIGAKFKALWRLKPDEHIVDDEFEWSTGKIYSYDEDKDELNVFLDEANKDKDSKHLILYEFPHEEVDYAEVKIIRDSKMPKPTAKREREPDDVSTEVPQVSAQLMDLTRAFIDGKTQKSTQNVEGGGFRIPVTIQENLWCLHPTVWWARRANGDEPEVLSKKLAAELLVLQHFLGAVQTTTEMRDAIDYQATVICDRIKLPLSDRPKSLKQWLIAFTAPLTWLRLVLTVAHGQQIATTAHTSAMSAIRKGGVLDLADLIATAEETTTKEKLAGDFRATQTATNEVRRIVANAMAETAHPAQESSWRARGRGGWRGGRGGRGGFRGQL
jgi:hypothetical protein